MYGRGMGGGSLRQWKTKPPQAPKTTGQPGSVGGPGNPGAPGAGAPAGTPAATGGSNSQGHGWGRRFMDQYGKPPGHMRDQWRQFRGGHGGGGGGHGHGRGGMRPPQSSPIFDQWKQAIQAWRTQRPAQPDMSQYRQQSQQWMSQRPQWNPSDMSGWNTWWGQRPENPRAAMKPQIQAWRAQRPDWRTMMANSLASPAPTPSAPASTPPVL